MSADCIKQAKLVRGEGFEPTLEVLLRHSPLPLGYPRLIGPLDVSRTHAPQLRRPRAAVPAAREFNGAPSRIRTYSRRLRRPCTGPSAGAYVGAGCSRSPDYLGHGVNWGDGMYLQHL
jgi:hypothetical protein